MFLAGNPSIESDQLHGEESTRLFLSSSPVTIRSAFEKRAIEYIPIDLDPSTLKSRERRGLFTCTNHLRWLPSREFKFEYTRSASRKIRPSLRPYAVQAPGFEIFYTISGGKLD